jgi:aspartate oxidase
VWRRGDLSLVEIRRVLDSSAGVLRSGAGLTRGLRVLRSGAGSATAADAAEMASMICSAALARPLSLGAHQRLDQPAPIAV